MIGEKAKRKVLWYSCRVCYSKFPKGETVVSGAKRMASKVASLSISMILNVKSVPVAMKIEGNAKEPQRWI